MSRKTTFKNVNTKTLVLIFTMLKAFRESEIAVKIFSVENVTYSNLKYIKVKLKSVSILIF